MLGIPARQKCLEQKTATLLPSLNIYDAHELSVAQLVAGWVPRDGTCPPDSGL